MSQNQEPIVNVEDLRLKNGLLEELFRDYLYEHAEQKQTASGYVKTFSMEEYVNSHGDKRGVWFFVSSEGLYRVQSFADLEPLIRQFHASLYLMKISADLFQRLYEEPARLMALGAAREAELQREAEEARQEAIRAATPPPVRAANMPLADTGIKNSSRVDARNPGLTMYHLLEMNSDQMLGLWGMGLHTFDEFIEFAYAKGFLLPGEEKIWPAQALKLAPEEWLAAVAQLDIRPEKKEEFDLVVAAGQVIPKNTYGDEPYIPDAQRTSLADPDGDILGDDDEINGLNSDEDDEERPNDFTFADDPDDINRG